MPSRNDQSRICRRSQRISGKVEIVDERRPQTRARKAKVKECPKPAKVVKPMASPSPPPSPSQPPTRSPSPPLASRLRRSSRFTPATAPPPVVKKVSTVSAETPSTSAPVTPKSKVKNGKKKIEQPPLSLHEPTPPPKTKLPVEVEVEPQPSTSFAAPEVPPTPSPKLLARPEITFNTLIKENVPATKTVHVRLPTLPVFKPIPSDISKEERIFIMQKRQRLLKAYREKQLEAFLKAGIELKPKHVQSPDELPSKKPVRRRPCRNCCNHRTKNVVKINPKDGLLTIRGGRVLKRETMRKLRTKLQLAKARIMGAQQLPDRIVLPNGTVLSQKKLKPVLSKLCVTPLSSKVARKIKNWNTGPVRIVRPRPKRGKLSFPSVVGVPMGKDVAECLLNESKVVVRRKVESKKDEIPKRVTRRLTNTPNVSSLQPLPFPKASQPAIQMSEKPAISQKVPEKPSVGRIAPAKPSVTPRLPVIVSKPASESVQTKPKPTKAIVEEQIEPVQHKPLPCVINGRTLRPRRSTTSQPPSKPMVADTVIRVQPVELASPAPRPAKAARLESTLSEKQNQNAVMASLTHVPHSVETSTTRHATVRSKSMDSARPLSMTTTTFVKPRKPPISVTVQMPESVKLDSFSKGAIKVAVKDKSGKIVNIVAGLSSKLANASISRSGGTRTVVPPKSAKFTDLSTKLANIAISKGTATIKQVKAVATTSAKPSNSRSVSFGKPTSRHVSPNKPGFVTALSTKPVGATPKPSISRPTLRSKSTTSVEAKSVRFPNAGVVSPTKYVNLRSKSATSTVAEASKCLVFLDEPMVASPPKPVNHVATVRSKSAVKALDAQLARPKATPSKNVVNFVNTPAILATSVLPNGTSKATIASKPATVLPPKPMGIVDALRNKAAELEASQALKSAKKSTEALPTNTVYNGKAEIKYSIEVPSPKPVGIVAALRNRAASLLKASPIPVESPKAVEVTPCRSAKRKLTFTKPAESTAVEEVVEVEEVNVRPVRSAKAKALTKVCKSLGNMTSPPTSPIAEKPLTNGKSVAGRRASMSSIKDSASVELEEFNEVVAKPLTNGKMPSETTEMDDDEILEVVKLVEAEYTEPVPLTNGVSKRCLRSSARHLEEESPKPTPAKRVRLTTPPKSPSPPVKEEQTPPVRTSMRSAKLKALEVLPGKPVKPKSPLKSPEKVEMLSPTPVMAESTLPPPVVTSEPAKPAVTIDPKPSASSPTKTLKRKAEPFLSSSPVAPIIIHQPRSLKRRAPEAVVLPKVATPKPPPQKRQKMEVIVPIRVQRIKRRPIKHKPIQRPKRIVLFQSGNEESLNVLRMPANFDPRKFRTFRNFYEAGMVGKPKKRPPIPASEIIGIEENSEEEETGGEEEVEDEEEDDDKPPARNLRSRNKSGEQSTSVEIEEEPSPDAEGNEAEAELEGEEKKKRRRKKRRKSRFNVRRGPDTVKTTADEVKLEYLKKMDKLLRAEPPQFKQHDARKLGRALPVTFKKLIAIAYEYHKMHPSSITMAVQDMKTSKFTGLTLLPKYRLTRCMRDVPKDRIQRLLPIPRRQLKKLEEKLVKPNVKPRKSKSKKPAPTPTPKKRILTRVTKQRQQAVKKPVKKKVIQKPKKVVIPPRRTTRSMARKMATKRQQPPKKQVPKKKQPKKIRGLAFRKWRGSQRPDLKIELLNNLKWLSLLTPCQAKCGCQAFKTDRVKWSLDARNQDVEKLKVTSYCNCKHPLWMHRRKYKTVERRKRVDLMEDISILQKILLFEKNPEKSRIYFLLWKDLVRVIQYNLPLPKDQVRYARLMHDPTSIRRMFNVFVNHNNACPDFYTDQHCVDLLTTVNDFKLPSPNKTWLLHFSFLQRNYEGTVVEESFKNIYRNHYVLWFTFCYISRALKTVPTLNLIDIFGPHVFQMFYEAIGLRLEERLTLNSDTYVATVSALYRRFTEYVEVNFFNEDDVPSLEGFNERSGPPDGLNILHSDYRIEQIPTDEDRVPAVEALDQPTGILALDPNLRVQFLEKPLEQFTLKNEIIQFLVVKVLKSLYKKNHKYIFQKDVLIINNHWPNTSTITDLYRMHDVHDQMVQQEWLAHFDTETEKNFASGGLVLMVVDGKTSFDRPVMGDLLAQFAAVIHTQLPKMPRHYILRLLLNSKHKCMILVKYDDRKQPLRTWRVVGGICFRPFPQQEFSEIVFVTISTENQVHGYGTFLMNELKRYHVEHLGYEHLLTYADNNAFGYFKKQHFKTDVPIPEVQYNNFIKCYDGAKLMYCKAKMCNNPEEEQTALKFMIEKLDQFELMLVKDRDKKFKASDIMRQQGIIHRPMDKWYPESVLDYPEDNNQLMRTLVALCGRRPKPLGNFGIERKLVTTIVPRTGRQLDGILYSFNEVKVRSKKGKEKMRIFYEITGCDQSPDDYVDDSLENIRETPIEMILQKNHPDSMKIDLLGLPLVFTEPEDEPEAIEESEYKMTVHIYQKTKLLLAAMKDFSLSWPFHYPVDEYDAPTYAESVYMPMTLEIIGNRLRNMYYKNVEMVFADFNRIFVNCYSFNEQLDGYYYHCCYRCHQYFNQFATHVFSDFVVLDFLMPIPECKTTFPENNRKKTKVAFEPLRPYWYPDIPDSEEEDEEEETDVEEDFSALMAAVKKIRKEEAKAELAKSLKPKPVAKAKPSSKGRSSSKAKGRSASASKGRSASKSNGRSPSKSKAKTAAVSKPKSKASEPKSKSSTKSKSASSQATTRGRKTTESKTANISEEAEPGPRTRNRKQSESTTVRTRTRSTANHCPARQQRATSKKGDAKASVSSPPRAAASPAHRTPSSPKVRAPRNAAAIANMLICKTTPQCMKPTKPVRPVPAPALKPEAVKAKVTEKETEKVQLPKPSPRSPPKKWIQTKLSFAPIQKPKRTPQKAAQSKPMEEPKEKSKSPEVIDLPPPTRTSRRAVLRSAETSKEKTKSAESDAPMQQQETPKKSVNRKATVEPKEKTPTPEAMSTPPQIRTPKKAVKPRLKPAAESTPSESEPPALQSETPRSPEPVLSPLHTRTSKKAAKKPEVPSIEAVKSPEPEPQPETPKKATRQRRGPKSPEPVPIKAEPITPQKATKSKSKPAEKPKEKTPTPEPEPAPSPVLTRTAIAAKKAAQTKPAEELKEKTPELVQPKLEPVTPKKAPKSRRKPQPEPKEKSVSPEVIVLSPEPEAPKLTRARARRLQHQHEEEDHHHQHPEESAPETEEETTPTVRLTRAAKRASTMSQTPQRRPSDAKAPSPGPANRRFSNVTPKSPEPSTSKRRTSDVKAESPEPAEPELRQVKEEPRTPSPRHTRASTRAATKASANLPNPRRRGKKQ